MANLTETKKVPFAARCHDWSRRAWQSLKRRIHGPKLFDPARYPDFMADMPFDSDAIKDMIAEYSLEFHTMHDDYVEWRMKLPMFVDAFYDHVTNKKNIPTQEEFWTHYVDFNAAYFRENDFSDYMTDAIKARAYRAYPSLVRDLYFNQFVKERLRRARVIYNKTLDIEEGIDMMITFGDDEHYGINLYTGTNRACLGRKRKKRRHTRFENVHYIDLPVVFRGKLRSGSFFLYDEDELAHLLSHVRRRQNWFRRQAEVLAAAAEHAAENETSENDENPEYENIP